MSIIICPQSFNSPNRMNIRDFAGFAKHKKYFHLKHVQLAYAFVCGTFRLKNILGEWTIGNSQNVIQTALNFQLATHLELHTTNTAMLQLPKMR